MQMKLGILPFACAAGLLLATTPPAAAQSPGTPEPVGLDTRSIVEHLADDALEGRLTGSPGIRLAADYIIEQLEAIGAVPLPALADFRQPFRYTAGVTDAGTTLRIEGDEIAVGPGGDTGGWQIVAQQIRFDSAESRTTASGSVVLTATSGGEPAVPEPLPVTPPDPPAPPAPPAPPGGTTATAPPAPPSVPDGPVVRALSFSESGTVEGPLVFAGYGLTVPETDDFSYDSYATLDVTDKIVVVLRYFPEDTEGELRAMLARYAGLRYKATAARERGARGLIVVTGPRSPNAGALVPLRFDTAVSDSDIVAATVNGALGAAIIESAGRSLEEVQASFDTANPHVAGFDLPLEATLDVRVETQEATGHNVIGYLPPTREAAADAPYVLLGAHYDHLGRGRGGDSLARDDEAGQIHNGADDNASGVAAVLAAGARLASGERDRGVILALWSGEELGLLGSADFVAQAPVPMGDIAAYLNFDMVGRLRDNALTLQAVGSSSIWTDLVTELNGRTGFDLALVADPYLPTDVRSLNAVEVPTLNFFTGSHEDYHRPTDDAHTLNYEGLDRIVELATAVAADLVERPDAPDFVRVEEVQQRGGGATMRIFTGTIPDYSQDVEGLAISGVVGGGPADEAGLEGGDVIVGLAGRTVTNIYDYMYALDLLKVGEPTEVVVLRNGERIVLELVPRVRE
ncbi:MAG: M28 family peptidase [Acidobacteria bacterium]|nr:M28 family peptidase [Acidobacteriota bacterium]